MKNLEIKILEYIYQEGEADSRKQGYESGVFTAFPFEISGIVQGLKVDNEAVLLACQNLSDNSYISLDEETITVNEIGWAYYIDNHFKR